MRPILMRKNVEHYEVFCINYCEGRQGGGAAGGLIIYLMWEGGVGGAGCRDDGGDGGGGGGGLQVSVGNVEEVWVLGSVIGVQSGLRESDWAVPGLGQTPVSCAGQLLAEPRALALLQNTLRLDETLLVTGGGDAWETDPSLLLLCYDNKWFYTDYAGTVAVLLCWSLQTSPATAAVTTPGNQADTQGCRQVAHTQPHPHQYPGTNFNLGLAWIIRKLSTV